MKNRIIAIILTITLLVTLVIPVVAAGDGNWGDDNAPWNVGITNDKLLGNYELGTSKEFEIAYYPSDSVGLKAIRHIEITGDYPVSGFEYYENGKWNDVEQFTSEIVFKDTTKQKVHVTFNKEGKYTIKFWASTADGNQSVVAKRVINVTKTSIELYREVETTPTVVPTTKDIEPITTEPATVVPTTKDETESEAPTQAPTEEPTTEQKTEEPTTENVTQAPTTKPITTEPVTIKPTTVVPTTKSVTTTAAQKVKVGKTAIKKAVKQKKAKKAKISFKKVKKVSGYQVQISTSAKFVNKLTITKNIKKTSCTIKALKAKKVYYVRARAYIVKGKKKYYGTWTVKKKVKFIK